MNRRVVSAGGLLAGFLGILMLLDAASNTFGAAHPCDFLTPTASTGSCGTPAGYVRCEDQTTQGACGNPNSNYADVWQDFPTGCTNNRPNLTNCNEPDSACWRKTGCLWDPDGIPQCQADPLPNEPWVPAKKRTEVACPPPPGGGG